MCKCAGCSQDHILFLRHSTYAPPCCPKHSAIRTRDYFLWHPAFVTVLSIWLPPLYSTQPPPFTLSLALRSITSLHAHPLPTARKKQQTYTPPLSEHCHLSTGPCALTVFPLSLTFYDTLPLKPAFHALTNFFCPLCSLPYSAGAPPGLGCAQKGRPKPRQVGCGAVIFDVWGESNKTGGWALVL